MLLFKTFYFDSAHYLPNVAENHKCRNMHGHTYKLIAYFEGNPNNNEGWIVDFGELKEKISPVIDTIDHKVLNEIPGLQNPTCELIAVWLWNEIKIKVPSLKKIELHETPTTGVIYEGA